MNNVTNTKIYLNNIVNTNINNITASNIERWREIGLVGSRQRGSDSFDLLSRRLLRLPPKSSTAWSGTLPLRQ